MPTTAPNGCAELAVTDGVASVRLTDPDRYNAFTLDLGADLTHLIDEVEARDDVSVVTLTSEGGVFCAGLDIDVVTGDDGAARSELIDYLHATRGWFRHCDHPVIVGVQGAAPGAGALFTTAGDVRVLGEDAELWWPELRLGMKAYGQAVELVEAVGVARASELMLLGEDAKLGAAEAKSSGLANRVVAREEIEDTVAGMAATVADRDTEDGLVAEYTEVLRHARRERLGASMAYANRLED